MRVSAAQRSECVRVGVGGSGGREFGRTQALAVGARVVIAAARVARAVRAAGAAAAVFGGTGAAGCVRVRATRAMLGAAIHWRCQSAHMRRVESSRSMRGESTRALRCRVQGCRE